MKKLLALFFLSFYLLSTTELAQLLKVPVLVVHFLEHKDHDHTISFVDFIGHHYKGDHLLDHPLDDDYEQDIKLPFMVHSSVLSVDFVVTNPLRFEAKKRKVPIVNRLKTRPTDDSLIEFNFQSSIWQPPKFS